MLSKVRSLNEALPGMIATECLYLIIGEVIILALVPDKSACAVGLLAGVIYAIFSSAHMSFTVRKVVYGGGHRSAFTMVADYLIRLFVMLALLAILYLSKTGDLLCAIIGMFSTKVAAYLWPVIGKRFFGIGDTSADSDGQADNNIIAKESE